MSELASLTEELDSARRSWQDRAISAESGLESALRERDEARAERNAWKGEIIRERDRLLAVQRGHGLTELGEGRLLTLETLISRVAAALGDSQ